jgi:hypothetical protein
VKFCALILASLTVGAAAADSWSRADAESLLKTWCDALVKYQVRGTGDAALDGGVLCPACCFEHGRVADSVYALVYEWKRTGERKYLDAAERMLDWTERNMVTCDGANYNDVKVYWRGITVFSQTSLGKTLLVFGDDLPKELKEKWTARFRVQTDYLLGFFSNGLGDINVNYPITFCEAMAVAWKLLGDDAYKAKGDAMYELVKPLFLDSGLLAGEGHPNTGVSPRGCRPIDLGYNLEESIPALYHYAELAGRGDIVPELDRLVAGHLKFMLPDGGVDNSMGSRSCKWSYWGSRTSDGLLPALANYAKHGGKGAVRAIDRHLKLLARCTSDTGLLYGGLYYREAGEPPCIHHTFAHVKSLVDLLLAAPPEKAADEQLPREEEYGRCSFGDLATELVAVGPWRASFSANDFYCSDDGMDVGGGSLTMLWHPAFGVVAAATMSDYWYAEFANFQDQRRYIGVLSTTPRVESADGAYSSVRDRASKVSASYSDGVFAYSASGLLTARKRNKGAPFRLEYTLEAKGLTAKAHAEGKFRYVFPVVATDKDEVTVDGRTALVRRPGGTLRISSDREIMLLETQRGKRAFTPVAGLMTAVFYVEGDGEDVTLSVSTVD